MKKESLHLTKSEEELMGLFWGKAEPLTSVDILHMGENNSWKGKYVHMMLRSLQKKGLLEVCGMEQSGSNYARKFRPMVTKEEYAAKLVLSKGSGKDYVAKVAMALVQETEDEEETDEKEK